MRLHLVLLVTAGVLTAAAAVALLRRGDGAREAVDAAIRQRYPRVRAITAEALLHAARRGAAPVLVDVRTAEEFAVSHLAGARRVAPEATADALAGVPRDTFVVVYCAVGWRSAAFAERLRAAGYTRVANLDGGLFAWANAGHPVERDGQVVRQVHPYDALWGRLLRRELHAYGRE